MRVEPDGSTVIAGSATPNSKLEVIGRRQGRHYGRMSAPTGDFAAVLDNPLPPGRPPARAQVRPARTARALTFRRSRDRFRAEGRQRFRAARHGFQARRGEPHHHRADGRHRRLLEPTADEQAAAAARPANRRLARRSPIPHRTPLPVHRRQAQAAAASANVPSVMVNAVEIEGNEDLRRWHRARRTPTVIALCGRQP
ncbi:hypothetical protein [Rhizobium yanglingense]